MVAITRCWAICNVHKSIITTRLHIWRVADGQITRVITILKILKFQWALTLGSYSLLPSSIHLTISRKLNCTQRQVIRRRVAPTVFRRSLVWQRDIGVVFTMDSNILIFVSITVWFLFRGHLCKSVSYHVINKVTLINLRGVWYAVVLTLTLIRTSGIVKQYVITSATGQLNANI